jgi:hypothetical protein
MALESSLRGLQLWFRSCPDQRSGRGTTKSQSPGSPNRDNFGTTLRESKPGQFRDSTSGVPGKRAIRMPLPWANAEYTIGSMVVASPESGPWCVM